MENIPINVEFEIPEWIFGGYKYSIAALTPASRTKTVKKLGTVAVDEDDDEYLGRERDREGGEGGEGGERGEGGEGGERGERGEGGERGERRLGSRYRVDSNGDDNLIEEATNTMEHPSTAFDNLENGVRVVAGKELPTVLYVVAEGYHQEANSSSTRMTVVQRLDRLTQLTKLKEASTITEAQFEHLRKEIMDN